SFRSMSQRVVRRIPFLPLSSAAVAALGLAASAAQAQTARGGTGLRTQTPAYVAQPRAEDASQANPGATGVNPSAGPQEPPAGVSQRAPPRASSPVQAAATRGVTQRQFRAPQPVVTGLPATPEPVAPPRRRPAVEEDPYAPLGLRLGSVTLRPAITNSIGYDTNPQRVSGAPRNGSAFSRHEGEIGVQSDWNVHELTGQLRGGYFNYFRDSDASRPDADGTLALRLDATRDTRILLETRARLDTQRPGSPDLNAPVQGRPQIYQYGGSAGVSHDINRLQLTLRGSVDRSDYEDATLTNGAKLSQKDRNQTQYGVRLRASYELTPGLRPFIQGEADTRQFDQARDSSGYARSSTGLTGRVGSTFELSRLVTGEISVGYQDRAYDDNRLKNLRGLVGDAAVIWQPTPLTTVTLRGTSELGDTTIAGSSGTTARRATLEVAHALRRNLTVTGFGSISRTDYEGQGLREDLASYGARLDYKLTRSVSIRASFTQERLISTAQGSDYTANIAQVGLRLQF
ncbi:MAG: outer membrane beta-barrel protein, partial [Bosea sp. (in: a-proteobacteria)]